MRHDVGQASSIATAAIPGVVIAITGFYPTLGAWWFHDDWVFLADAAGLADKGSDLVRFVFYKVYWLTMYGAFGANPIPYAVTRIIAHILCAVLVVLIGTRLRLSWLACAVAGAVFAASPVGFECLYWGTGMVEQMCALFGLLTIYLLLRPERRLLGAAFVTAFLAIFSKEACFFLPAIWAYAAQRRGTRMWLNVLGTALLTLGVIVTLRVTGTDLVQSGDYHLALTSLPRVFLTLGFWLVAPAPLMRGLELHSVIIAVAGLVMWGSWVWLVFRGYTREKPLALVFLLLTVLPLVPATLVGDHAVPRYLYASLGAFSLAIGQVVSDLDGTNRWRSVVVLTVFGSLLAWTATSYRLDARWRNGTPIHRLVVKQELSQSVFSVLREAVTPETRRVVFLTPESWPGGSQELLRDTMGGDLGVRVIFGPEYSVKYVRRLTNADQGAVVVRIKEDGRLSFGHY